MCQGHPDRGTFTIRKRFLDHEASLPPDHSLSGESTDASPQESTPGQARQTTLRYCPGVGWGPKPQFNIMGLLLLKPSYENSTE